MVTPELGDIVADRYRVDGELGTGGFGAVYAATDLQSGAAVALKLLRLARNPTIRLRFRREAALLERVDHPGIVRLVSHGETEDGALFLALELMAGEDLSDLLARRQRLSADETTEVLAQLLSALDAAHSVGIIHRDIKPENIRVVDGTAERLQVKLLDFGIARDTEAGAPSMTATGEFIGTPRYMSPEQLSGRPLSPTSDLYSLGLVGVELLLGRGALAGNSPLEQLNRARTGHIYTLPPDVLQSPLGTVIARLATPRPSDRYPSARAALNALHGRSFSRPADAPTDGHRRGWAIGGAAAAALAVVAGAYVAGGHAPAPPPPGTRANPLRATPAPAPADVGLQHDATDVNHGPDLVADAGVAAEAPTGCGHPPPFRGHGELAFGPAYVPRGYDANVRHPMLVLLHDDRLPPDSWLRTGGFPEVADSHGVVVIAPLDDGLPGLPAGPHNAWRDGVEDAEKVGQAARSAAAALCIDGSRVFVVATGHAGTAARTLACADWVAGIGLNSHHFAYHTDCTDPRPIALFAPAQSEKMPAHGGNNCAGRRVAAHEETELQWRKRNHCGAPLPTTPHHRGTCQRFDCEFPVLSCLVDGGFGWPGARRVIEEECGGTEEPADFPTAAVAWEFFASLDPLSPRSAAVEPAEPADTGR